MNVSRALRAVPLVVVCLLSGSAGVCFAATDWSPAVLLTQPFDITTNIIQVTPIMRGGVFRESDRISIQTTDNSAFQIFDLNGATVYSGNSTTLTLPRGHYIVEGNDDRTQFCVLPDDYVGASFLGTEADNGQDIGTTQRITAINPAWVRVFQSIWANVETNRDAWDWSDLDQTIAANPGRKIIAISADQVPSWVNPDEIIPLHTAYVQALAKRYKGKLSDIEIWNEPFHDKFPGNNLTNVQAFVDFYLQMFSQARKIIKAADGKVQVIGPAWSSFEQLTSLSMATNKLSRFDGWSWHDYSRGTYAPDINFPAPVWIPAVTKDNFEVYFGRFMDLKSLFVDELGFFGHSALGADTTADQSQATSLDWYRGMCRAVKTTVMYRAMGLSCILPHVIYLSSQLSNLNFELYGWDVGIRGPHPKTSAFLMTCYWLNGATIGDARVLNNQAYLYTWKRPKTGTFVIAWCVEGQSRNITPPPGYQMTDIYGTSVTPTTLGEEPIIFRPIKNTSPDNAADAVQAALGG